MENIKIAPSILSADFSKMGDEVRSLAANGTDWIHCDVMDGVFVPNITFGIKMIADIRKTTDLPLDCHLMITHPERYVERFVQAGADIVTVHYEACKENLKEVLLQIKAAGAKCGAVINPDTPVSVLTDVVPYCDVVLVMSVFPGFGGQKFLPEALDKLRAVRALVSAAGHAVDIEVDGGVTLQNAAEIRAAGANVLVAGNTVFSAPNRSETIRALRGAR